MRSGAGRVQVLLGTRPLVLAVASILAAGLVLSPRPDPWTVRAAAGRIDSGWHLGSVYYPRGTSLVTTSAVSNADIQDFFGGLHISTYAGLQRLSKRGWMQIGTLVKATGHGRVHHVLTWSYAVSYYPTPAGALHAVADVRKKTKPLPEFGTYGRVARFWDVAGYHDTFSTIGSGTVVVEMLCTVQRHDEPRYGQLLGQYCTQQRQGLARLVAEKATPATAPVAPSPTPVPPDTISPPILGFYSHGSHDTCVLSDPTVTFPNTVPEMYVMATFATWRGHHDIVYEWYSPSGMLFFNTSYAGTDLGSSVLCAWMSIANTDAASVLGVWTLRVRIDGQEAASAAFTMTAGAASTARHEILFSSNLDEPRT